MAPLGYATMRGTLAVLPLEDVCQARQLARAWREEVHNLHELPCFQCALPSRALGALPLLAQHLPCLARGSLVLRLDDAGYQLQDLEALEGSGGELLGELSLLLVEGTSDESLARLLRGCRRLRVLEVSDYDLVGGQNLRGHFLKELPPCLESLAVRVLPAVSDDTLQCAVAAAPNLRFVECVGLDEVTDTGLRTLASLPRLQGLRLALTRLGQRPQISEETLLLILEGCAAASGQVGAAHGGLEVLEITVSVGPPLFLSGGGAPFAAALCKHTVLRTLILSRVYGLTDAGLEVLARACPDLRELVLFRPGELFSGEGLLRCLSQLPHLESLTLGAVARFKDAFAAVCAACSERLAWLKMTRYFNSAGSADVAIVLQRLRAFRCLDTATISGTFSIGQVRAAEELVAAPGGLHFREGISLQQLGDQSFQAEWSRPGDRQRCAVLLDRCLL